MIDFEGNGRPAFCVKNFPAVMAFVTQSDTPAT